jgi:hypothetical protein
MIKLELSKPRHTDNFTSRSYSIITCNAKLFNPPRNTAAMLKTLEMQMADTEEVFRLLFVNRYLKTRAKSRDCESTSLNRQRVCHSNYWIEADRIMQKKQPTFLLQLRAVLLKNLSLQFRQRVMLVAQFTPLIVLFLVCAIVWDPFFETTPINFARFLFRMAIQPRPFSLESPICLSSIWSITQCIQPDVGWAIALCPRK